MHTQASRPQNGQHIRCPSTWNVWLRLSWEISASPMNCWTQVVTWGRGWLFMNSCTAVSMEGQHSNSAFVIFIHHMPRHVWFWVISCKYRNNHELIQQVTTLFHLLVVTNTSAMLIQYTVQSFSCITTGKMCDLINWTWYYHYHSETASLQGSPCTTVSLASWELQQTKTSAVSGSLADENV